MTIKESVLEDINSKLEEQNRLLRGCQPEE